MFRQRAALGLTVGVVLACDAAPPVCIDLDLDGLGEGCPAGPDCDDENAARGLDCVGVPPPDCEAEPTATGCPCLAGSAADCFPGTDGARAGVGVCRAGRTRCLRGHWGSCEGAVGPRAEFCDGLDQDCDGRIDEGVRSACGGCDRECTGDLWGDPFRDEDLAEGLARTEAGELTLALLPTESATVWVPSAGDGTVSRIDAASATETARYLSGDPGIAQEPARVAVDWNGDAWIANRAFDAEPSVVRIAARDERCEDRDGSGTIATSTGPDDVRAWGQDECVLASTIVGAAGEVARAIAIDGDRGLDGASGGDAWVGLHEGMAFVEVDGLRGVVLRRIATPGFQPYAAAFDRWGTLWAIARDGLLARIDPRAEPPEVRLIEAPLACWLFYGLAIDAEGRIAITGFSCDQVVVYDPRSDRWEIAATDPSPRGATFDGRALWVAHTAGTLSRLSLSPLRVVQTVDLADDVVRPTETIGLGVDSSGSLWAIAGGDGVGGSGLAIRVQGGEVTAVPVGWAPHVHGDLTGAQRFGAPVPRAVARHVFSGCPDGSTEWIALHVAADPGTRGSVGIEVRHAPSEAVLDEASWVPLGTIPDDTPPFPLALETGGVLEVRVTLAVSASLGAPRLRHLGVQWRCRGPD